MTGHLSRVVTCIHEMIRPYFICVWCLLLQMDIVMLKTYKSAGCGFYKTLTSLISVLRGQKILIDEMQAICSNLSATH